MNDMIKVIDKYLFIQMPKELDHHNSEIIRKKADRIIETRNINMIIFDFENTEFMDSSGIGIILGRYKNISMSGGSVAAIHLNNRMKKIFVMSGLYKVVSVLEDVPIENV